MWICSYMCIVNVFLFLSLPKTKCMRILPTSSYIFFACSSRIYVYICVRDHVKESISMCAQANILFVYLLHIHTNISMHWHTYAFIPNSIIFFTKCTLLYVYMWVWALKREIGREKTMGVCVCPCFHTSVYVFYIFLAIS